jgi:predicted RNase H-like HicB family nuclease
MSVSIQLSSSNHPLKLTLVLEQLASGGVVASVMEFPQCRVEAETRETALTQIKHNMTTFLEKFEFLPLEIAQIATESSVSPWVKYAGIFENDPDFAAIATAIRAERDTDDDTEVDPSTYALQD